MNAVQSLFTLFFILALIYCIFKTHVYARENCENIRKIMKHLGIDDAKEKDEQSKKEEIEKDTK